MIKVSEVVHQILFRDGFAVEAMQRGLLNMRAYAHQIHEEVELKAKKPVSVGTIVVSLLRIKKRLAAQPDFSPVVRFSHLSITSNVATITYDKTQVVAEALRRLDTGSPSLRNFFTVTEGLHEVTFIIEQSLITLLKNQFHQSPKMEITQLVAISVRIPETYIEVPNTIYSLLGALAVRHVNVLEIVSTYTELTFVVSEQEMEVAIQTLRAYLQRIK